jgi:hypothetical protein
LRAQNQRLYIDRRHVQKTRDREQRHTAQRKGHTCRPETETYRPVAETYSPATMAFCTVNQNHEPERQIHTVNTRGRNICICTETHRQLLLIVYFYMEEIAVQDEAK